MYLCCTILAINSPAGTTLQRYDHIDWNHKKVCQQPCKHRLSCTHCCSQALADCKCKSVTKTLQYALLLGRHAAEIHTHPPVHCCPCPCRLLQLQCSSLTSCVCHGKGEEQTAKVSASECRNHLQLFKVAASGAGLLYAKITSFGCPVSSCTDAMLDPRIRCTSAQTVSKRNIVFGR